MAITINGEDTNVIRLKQKEAKQLTFTFNVPISTAEFSFIVKDKDGTTVITKSDSSFIKTEIASKIVAVRLTVTDLDLDYDETYNAEIKVVWDSESSVDKSETMKLKILESVH